MNPLVITFAAVFLIVYGIYWLLIDREEAARRAALRRRLRRRVPKAKAAEVIVKEQQKLSELGLLDSLLANAGQLLTPIQREIAQAGMTITVGTVILASLCAAGLTYVVVQRWLGEPLFALFFALCALFLPYAVVRRRARRRLAEFEEQFPEAMDLLARAMRAGHALTTGLAMVAEEIRAPLGPEFRQLFDEQNFGRPFPEALKAFAQRVPIVDARFFVTAVLTHREVGGNLSEVLDNLAAIIRERFRVKRQVRVVSAHGRITGWVLSAMPIVLAAFLASTSGETYRQFYTDPLGVRLIVAALALQAIGIFIISRIVRIEY